MNLTVRSLLLTAIIFIGIWAVLAVVFGLVLERGVWANYESYHCAEYCERSNQCEHEIADRPPVQQPANTWTNLFFLLAALLLLTRRFDMGTLTFALSSTYLCLGSFLFHASITRFWQVADVAGIYSVLFTLVAHGIHRLSGWPWKWLSIPVVVLSIIFTIFKRDMDSVGLNATVWLTVFIIILLVLITIHGVYTIIKIHKADSQRVRKIAIVVVMAILPALLFALGFMFRELDVNRTWCNPNSSIQGHGLWHFFAAAAMYFIWRFFDHSRLRKREPDERLAL